MTSGHDHATPGTAAFHATFVVADHSPGRFFSVETPVPFGPRNWSQSPAGTSAAAAITARAASRNRQVMGSLRRVGRTAAFSATADESVVRGRRPGHPVLGL